MNRLLLVAVWCIAKPVVGNAVGADTAGGAGVDNADNCNCECEAVDKPCRCVCDIKNGGEPFYQRPPQDVVDGWNREKGNFFEKTKRTVNVKLTEEELLEANARRDRETKRNRPWPATRTAALLATAAAGVAAVFAWLLRPLYAPSPPVAKPRHRKNAARRRRRAVSTETRREGRSPRTPRTPSDPARLRRLARRARPRTSRPRVAFSDADLASAAGADAAAALASHAPADAAAALASHAPADEDAALASHAPADAAPAAGPERDEETQGPTPLDDADVTAATLEVGEETQDAADADVVSQLSRLSVAGAEAEPRSPRSPRTPKDACVVCWERRREVACYPCMCVAASQRFPLILHLTPRLRGDVIAAASSQCLIRAGTSASARRAPARRTPARCAGGPSRTCSASSSPDLLPYHHYHRHRRRRGSYIYMKFHRVSVSTY